MSINCGVNYLIRFLSSLRSESTFFEDWTQIFLVPLASFLFDFIPEDTLEFMPSQSLLSPNI